LPPAKGDPYPRGVAEAILLSIDAVTATDPTGPCGSLLAIISLLSPEGVARPILYHAKSAGGTEVADEALGRLADASLLTFSGDDESDEPVVTSHRLVMRIVRERAAHDGSLANVGPMTFAMVAGAIRSFGELWRHRTAARDLVGHIIALNHHLAPYVRADDKALVKDLLSSRGWALRCINELGDSPAQAVELGESLVADRVRALGEDHPDTLTSQANLARAYHAAGRFGQAIPLHERTLADRERILGDDHPDTLTSRNNLASAYQATGRVNQAVPLYEQVLVQLSRVLGEEHPTTIIVRWNLARARQEAKPQGDNPARLGWGA
jgi:hypothetical protein